MIRPQTSCTQSINLKLLFKGIHDLVAPYCGKKNGNDWLRFVDEISSFMSFWAKQPEWGRVVWIKIKNL